MGRKTVEGRGAARRSRPSKDVARQTDALHLAHRPLAVYRFSQRLGCSVEVAAVLAELAYPALDDWRVAR